MMFGLTEAGPLAFSILSMGLGDYLFSGVIAVVILTLAWLSAHIPRSRVAVIGASIGILVWFSLGFAFAGLRIT